MLVRCRGGLDEMRRAGFRSVVARWISTSKASHGPTRRCYRAAAPQLRAPAVPKMGPQGLWNGALRGSSNQVLRVDAVRYLSAVSTEGSVDHQDSVAKLTKFCEEGRLNDALEAVETMAEQGVDISVALLSRIADECLKRKSLAYGRRLHSTVTRRGLELSSIGWNTLVSMWDRLREEGPPTEAVEALDLLVQSGFHVDTSFFYSVLKRCTAEKDLGLGTQVHILALRSGYESNAFLANHLIGMYASLERLDEAMQVFDKVAVPSSHLWASIILAHARNGQPAQALKLYRRMRQSMVKSDNHIFAAVLKACTTARDVASGKEVHADYLGSAVEPNIVTGNCLVDMHAKCGSLEDARRVFDNMPTKGLVTWTAMIAGYVEHEFGQAYVVTLQFMNICFSLAANIIITFDLEGQVFEGHL